MEKAESERAEYWELLIASLVKSVDRAVKLEKLSPAEGRVVKKCLEEGDTDTANGILQGALLKTNNRLN